MLKDATVYCSCGKPNFFDPGAAPNRSCWNCRSPIVPPMRLVVGQRTIVLSPHTKLYERHLDWQQGVRHRLKSSSTPPTTCGGLKNLGPTQLLAVLNGGSVVHLEAGQSVTLRPGTTLNYGTASVAPTYRPRRRHRSPSRSRATCRGTRWPRGARSMTTSPIQQTEDNLRPTAVRRTLVSAPSSAPIPWVAVIS